MLKTEDFSILSRISINMLKNYDEMNLLKPKWIDDETGCKYYSEDQLSYANRIQMLKSMGLSMKDINNILSKCSTDYDFEEYIYNELESNSEKIYFLKKQIELLENAKKDIVLSRKPLLEPFIVKEIPERNVISYRGYINNFSDVDKLWDTLNFLTKDLNIKYESPAMDTVIFHKISETETLDVEVQKSVEEISENTNNLIFKTIPKTVVVSTIFQGEYENLHNINQKIANWLLENEYELNGKIMNIYLSQNNSNDEQKFIKEICYPIKKI